MDKYFEYKTANFDPSGEDPANFDFPSFLDEDPEVKNLFARLLVFTIEGSCLTLKELRRVCYQQLINDHFPEFSSYLNDLDVEAIVN
jgi:hypothetical protein